MDSYHSAVEVLSNEEHNVFSEEFISSSLVKYLRANGYKVQKDKLTNNSGKEEKVITASTFFRKEIIEIRGYDISYDIARHTPDGKASVSPHPKFSFSEIILNSLINLGNFYRDEDVVISMAVPNLSRYKAIIERLHDYFTLNDLYFKIYLVNENGEVEVFNLNEHYSKASK